MKKTIAAAGVVLGGAALMLSVQGSAQAAPATPVLQQASVAKSGNEAAPMWIGSVAKIAQKAYVHGKAAAGTTALRNQVGNMTKIASLGSAPKNGTVAGTRSAETIFDK